MARYGFAVDQSIEFNRLRFPQQVEGAIARLIAVALGDDVLICHADALGGDYLGIARLASANLAEDGTHGWITFDRPRAFATEVSHVRPPFLDRLYLLDDRDVAWIVERGESQVAGFAEDAQAGIDWSATEALGATAKAADVCALTGQPLQSCVNWTTIWPAHSGTAGNLLAFSPAAQMAFLAGQFSARDDLSIILDARISPGLREAMNSTGKLLVPASGPLRPSPDCLSWHRHVVCHFA